MKSNYYIYAKCCNKFYSSYNKHNELNDHIIKVKNITKIKCGKCNNIQNMSNVCHNCNHKFSEYYCEKCKFLSKKEITHCDKCNKCYISNGKEMKHCDTCKRCFTITNYEKHNCYMNENDICQICQDGFKSINDSYYILDCNHKIHKSCMHDYKKFCYKNKKIWNCSICRKSINKDKDTKRIENVIGDDYENTDRKSNIMCYDCYGESAVIYHYKYHKCNLCNSYNTNKLNSFID